MDPEISAESLLGKWLFHSLEPGNTSLKILLCYRLQGCNPSKKGGKWPHSNNWMLVHGFTSTRGSRIWDKVIQAWKKLVKRTRITEPTNYEEVANTHLWWASHFIGGNFGFNIKRGKHLAKKGLLYIADLWDYENDRFRLWDTLKLEYRLRNEDRQHIVAFQRNIPQRWIHNAFNFQFKK